MSKAVVVVVVGGSSGSNSGRGGVRGIWSGRRLCGVRHILKLGPLGGSLPALRSPWSDLCGVGDTSGPPQRDG